MKTFARCLMVFGVVMLLGVLDADPSLTHLELFGMILSGLLVILSGFYLQWYLEGRKLFGMKLPE